MLTHLFSAALALASVATAAPASSLEARSPPSLQCAPSSIWSNGSLSIGAAWDAQGPSGDLAMRTFTNETTGKEERRVSLWSEGRSDLFKLSNIGGEYCNSTTFNYTYNLPQRPFQKDEPLRLRALDYGMDSGYGYNYSTCIGVGTTYDTPTDGQKDILPTKGTYPLSVQECSNIDFDQIAATQAQFFKQIFKYSYLVNVNGVATGQNPPDNSWYLKVDEETGDLYVTSEKTGYQTVFFLRDF